MHNRPLYDCRQTHIFAAENPITMALQQNFGRTVIKLRRQRKISPEQLALKAEIDRRYMRDIENGKRNISLDILERLAAALDISVSDLIKHAETIDIPTLTLEGLKQWLCANDHEDTVVLESPEYLDAIVGITEEGRLVYSYALMVESLVEQDGMAEDEAMEFIDYNTIRALPYAGDNAPIVMYDIEI